MLLTFSRGKSAAKIRMRGEARFGFGVKYGWGEGGGVGMTAVGSEADEESGGR
jgi:hypothetical protein